MSISVQESITSKTAEMANLKLLAERYPAAVFISGRLYEVDHYNDGDEPNHILFDNGTVFACLLIGDPANSGHVFLRAVGGRIMSHKAETLVSILFRKNPEAVLQALRF